MHEDLTIGELARRSGVAHSALRYYETVGLLTSTRTGSGQRRYRRDALRRIAVIQAAQRVGLSLRQVREGLADLPPDKAPSRSDWERLSRAWRADLDARIAALQRVRDDLTGCIGCGCLSMRRCALANPDDRQAAEGAGSSLLRLPSGATAPEP